MKRFILIWMMGLFLLGSGTAFAQTNDRSAAARARQFKKTEKKRVQTLAMATRKDEIYQRKLSKAKAKYENDQENLRQRYNRRQHQLASKHTKAGAPAYALEQELQQLRVAYESDQLALRQRFEQDRDKRQAAWEASRPTISLTSFK